MESQGRQPKFRRSNRSASKVPLTYYRSASKDSGLSPFKKKEPAAGEKVKGFFARVLDVGIVILLVIIFIYTLLLKSTAHVTLSSQTYHSEGEYSSAISKELSKPQNRNKITLSEKSITESLKKQFPEISNIAITLPIFSQTPTFRVNIAEPSFVLKNNQGQYIVGSKGRAVAEGAGLTNRNNLQVVEDKSDFVINKGEQVLTEDAVTFINYVIAQAKQSKIPIKKLIMPAKAQELDLYTNDKSYYVKFYLGGDPVLQMGQFLATRNKFNKESVRPSQYLDVRVPGKIFYK